MNHKTMDTAVKDAYLWTDLDVLMLTWSIFQLHHSYVRPRRYKTPILPICTGASMSLIPRIVVCDIHHLSLLSSPPSLSQMRAAKQSLVRRSDPQESVRRCVVHTYSGFVSELNWGVRRRCVPAFVARSPLVYRNCTYYCNTSTSTAVASV